MFKTIAGRLFRTDEADRRLLNARGIICDLDGTLLNRDEMISQSTARMIATLRGHGIEFVLATRRHHQAAEPYADLLHLDSPIISLDGAMIREPHAPAPTFVAEMDQEFARDILEEIEQTPGVAFSAVTPDRFFVSDADMRLPAQHQHWNINSLPITSATDAQGQVIEVIATGSYHGVNAVYNYVESKMRKGELKIRLYQSRSHEQSWFLEARPGSVDKRTAAERLVPTLGITMKQVIGIGDFNNDLELCRKAGYAVAMQNAIPELKQIADYVTPRTCADDGIDDFLALLLRTHGIDVEKILVAQQDPQQRRQRSR